MLSNPLWSEELQPARPESPEEIEINENESNPSRADQEKDRENIDLTEMSLEELMEVEVIVSASKYEQSIDRSPTAINVITAEEIRRSGAKTFADLLKRFPGVWTWTKTRTDYDIGLLGLMEDENPRVL
ncbi:MAG: TonB-dependent receptor plug domain-containing protein, partial [Planctomycetota bacterium]